MGLKKVLGAANNAMRVAATGNQRVHSLVAQGTAQKKNMVAEMRKLEQDQAERSPHAMYQGGGMEHRHQWKRAIKLKSEVYENGYNKGSKVGARDRQKSERDQVTTKQQENQGQAALS
jgi:hypothetical protein